VIDKKNAEIYAIVGDLVLLSSELDAEPNKIVSVRSFQCPLAAPLSAVAADRPASGLNH
jgi:hypothetical protein